MSETDKRAIRDLIERQFESLSWSPDRQPAWTAFWPMIFVDGAAVYGAARPARAQTVDGFVVRMKRLAETSLPALDEQLRGCKITVFGNVRCRRFRVRTQ